MHCKQIAGSILLVLILFVVCCTLYPLLVYGIAHFAFLKQAHGSIVADASGKPVGSSLIAQPFTKPHYFHPRPSAAGPKGWDGTNSSSSNMPIRSKEFREQLHKHAEHYRKINNLPSTHILPQDGVTASASGLDPHISKANALLQAPRVASARNIPLPILLKALDEHTEYPLLGLFGEERVNVLLLNLWLDAKADLPDF